MLIRRSSEDSTRGSTRSSRWLAVLVLAVSVVCGSAQNVVLSYQNSVAQINVGSQQGMHSWTVDGQEQLFQQWFWYRIGAAGAEHSIDTISPPIFNNTVNTLSTTYNGAGFNLNIVYTLLGAPAGSGVADMTEVITINNTSGAPLDFHFFQYSDFDLAATIGGQTAFLTRNQNPLSPNFNKFIEADQVSPLVAITETVLTPGANRGEAGIYPNTLNSLNDLNTTILSDNPLAGPGDATWALQWDLLLAADGIGSSIQISKDKRLTLLVIPEPSVLALAGLGLAGLLVGRRRRAA